MAELIEKILQTRIINKHGTYAEWVEKDPVLLEGEIALAKFTVTQEATDENGNVTVRYIPTYLMKIGEQDKKFSEVNWLSAPASDVYEWAKNKTINDVDLSSHTAITGLQAAIEALDYSDTEAGFVTAVTQTNGQIAVTKKQLTMADITDLEGNFASAGDLADLEERVGKLEARMTDLDNVMKSVTGAMHFVGITTTNPATDGATVRIPKVEGEGTETKASYTVGDVVIYKVAASGSGDSVIPAHDIEYVNVDGANTAASWVELGDVTDEVRRITALEKDLNALNGVVENIDNHSHSNKDLLDTIEEDNVHAHDNKDVLDGITAQDVTNWNNIFARDIDITEHESRLSALYTLFGNGSKLADVFILDCGGVDTPAPDDDEESGDAALH